MTATQPETGTPTAAATTPAPARKRTPSRATRAASKTQQPARKSNGNGKPAPAPKPAPAAKPAAKAPKEDGPNVLKNRIADSLIEFVGSEFVTRERARQIGVPFDLLQSECGRTLSYAPGKAWHRNLISPGTGRGQRHAL